MHGDRGGTQCSPHLFTLRCSHRFLVVRGYGLIDTFEGSSREYSGPRCHLITGTWVIATHPSDTECTFALVENFQADDPSVMGYSDQMCFMSSEASIFQSC